MKHEKINAAFDALSPTAEQIWRMRENLMEKLPKNAAEKPDRPVYTQRYQEPKRRRGWMGPIAAMLALALAAGVFQGTRTTPQEVQAAPAEALKTADGPLCEAYYEVLKTYDRAIFEDWTVNECWNADINSAVGRMDSLDELGYALLDIDYDGVEELLITGPEKHYLYNVNGIYAVFALDDQGNAVHVEPFPGEGAAVEVLCEDRTILFPRSPNPDSQEDKAYDFYRMEENKLIKFDYVSYMPAQDKKAPWFRYNQGKGTGDREPITKAEFDAVLASHEPVSFAYYSIEEALRPVRQQADNFQTILDRYRAAIYDRWNEGLCHASQVSVITQEVSHERELAYCLRDVDGDGTEDLLITNADGSELYSVYTRKGGRVEMHPLFQWWETSQRSPYVLMEDNTLGQKVGEGTYHFDRLDTQTSQGVFREEIGKTVKWYKWSGNMQFLDDFMGVVEIPEDADILDEASSQESPNQQITEAEAMKLINSYTPAKLDVSPLASILGENYAQNFTVLLERYAMAIRKDWSVERCQGGMLCGHTAQCRYPWELGYAMYDLDGDGTEELLITDGSGSRIYSAYTQKENRVEMLPFFQFSETSVTPLSYDLMADGTLHMSLGEGHHNYYRLDTMTSLYLSDNDGRDGKHDWQLQEGTMQFVTDYLQNQNIPDSVGMSDGPADTEKPQRKRLTDDEAKNLIASYEPARLTVLPLPDFAGGE